MGTSKIWTPDKKNLALSTPDTELTSVFPGHSLQGLKARQREFKRELSAVGLSSFPSITKLPDLSPDAQMDRLFRGYQNIANINIRKAKDGERIISLADTQGIFVDLKALGAVEDFMRDFQPHHIFYNGDNIEFYPISSFNQNPARQFTIQDELDFTGDMLDRHKKMVPKAKQHWLDGNHEERFLRYLWKQASALASLDDMNMSAKLKLEKRHVTYTPYSGHINYLGLLVTHGDRLRQHSSWTAKAMSERFRSSGLSGHSHRLGAYYWTGVKGPQVWYEQGCLCRLDPEYEAHPNWQHGFAYGIVHNNKVHIQLVSIFDGGFHYGDTYYGM